MRHRAFPCSAHERRIRNLERWGKYALVGLTVLLLRGDNPENLEWILRMLAMLLPGAQASAR